jgi:hypothetical protein
MERDLLVWVLRLIVRDDHIKGNLEVRKKSNNIVVNFSYYLIDPHEGLEGSQRFPTFEVVYP